MHNKRGSVELRSTGLFSKNGKKGIEMATNTIVMIVLGLIILVILIIFVQQQVTKSGKQYGQFGEEANIAADKCQSLVLGKFCASSCSDPKNQYKEVSPPPGGWSDCGKAKGFESKRACCEKA